MYRVVVVEDETIVRQGIIRDTDWSSIDCMVVGEAGNGQEGLEIIKRLRPDLVITDIRMPKMSGLEMAQILEKEKMMPVMIFLTAYDDFAYAQQAIKVGARDYVLKPFKDNVLEESIKKTLNRYLKKSDKKSEEQPSELSLKKGDKSKYLTAALSYIDANYSDPDLSAAKVAQAIGVSAGHLSHLFRKESSFTMSNYVLDCRMRAAKKLLQDYSHKVYEVAEAVGYRDITYFSVSFKKYVGVTPSEYQDRFRE
ncbi:MAG: response regulator [Lachnospiraceae bacterium]|nr:response regulator [Lachnospiraceae bacterium]